MLCKSFNALNLARFETIRTDSVPGTGTQKVPSLDKTDNNMAIIITRSHIFLKCRVESSS